jgi:hypothetical protein
MSRRVLVCPCVFVLTAFCSGPLAGQNPFGWIQSDQWACLVPLQGNDCSGNGVHVMKQNWVAPHDLTSEDPVVGDVWDDIDFGGAAKSAAWRGAGLPAWTNIGLGPDPNVVNWQAYCTANGLTDDFVMGIGVTYVRNNTAAPLWVGLCTASDDSVLVYVNNNCSAAVTVCRGTAADCAEVNPAVLAPGVNRIAVLVWEGFGGFGFRLALVKPDGSKYTQADPEIQVLGAADNFGGPGQFPVLRRSYPGSDFECPRDRYTITLSGSGFVPGTMYTVCEEVPGCATGDVEVANISASGSVQGIPQPDPPDSIAEFTTRTFVGSDIGGGSGTVVDDNGTPADPSDDVYTSTSTSGGDLWANGDDFEFIYTTHGGDFDVAIEFLRREGGNGRWGKFGLIARESLDRCSRSTYSKDHLAVFVDNFDCATLEGRLNHLDCGGGLFGNYNLVGLTGLADPLCHPRFLRLTRRGDQFQAWGSNLDGLADGALNPRDDCNWVPSSLAGGVTWTAPVPEELIVGFFNSEHNDQGAGVQTITFRVLGDTPGVPLQDLGRKIVWQVPGSVLNGAGVSYDLRAPRLSSLTLRGRVGPVQVSGPSRLFFQSPPSGPAGAFEGATDIGEGGPCTPGSLTHNAGEYEMAASGLDIWATGDQFHFAYLRWDGDFVMQARFFDYSHPAAGGRWGKTGLMARWDCRPNAAYYFTHNAGATNFNCDIDGPRDAYRPYSGQNGGNGEPYQVWWQDVFGDERVDALLCAPPSSTSFPYIRSNDIRGDERNLAPWLRMVRRGSTFYSYGSDDGRDWKSLGSFSWPEAPETLLVGAALTSHANCEVQRVHFDSFSIAAPPPLGTEVPPDASLAELRALPGEELLSTDFEDGDENQPPPGWVTHRWGGPVPRGFDPQVAGGRLRMGDIRNSPLGSGEDTGTSAFWPEPIDPRGAYLFDFDVHFSYNQALAGDGNPPADGLTFAVLGTLDVPRQDHTPVEDIVDAAGGGGAVLLKRTTVGTDRRGESTTALQDGLYTTVSSTGRDLWVDGDSFEFAYNTLRGDFDVSVEIVAKRFPPGGRWGKFGLMARQSLAHNAKHGSIQDHGPDLQDPARYARRLRHQKVWEMEEPATALGFGIADPNDGSSVMHPRFLRLTRRGDVVAGWVSNTAGDIDPADDLNWVQIFADDTWQGVDRACVGFAYSVHNSSGDSSGAIDWRLVEYSGEVVSDPADDPVPHHLDLRFGDRGGSLGYNRINQTHHAGEGVVRSRDLSVASFAVEFDNWHGSQIENDGDAGNVSGFNPLGGAERTGTGAYHIGLNVAASIFTAQRNHQVGVHDDDLQDIYHSAGLHAAVLYDHGRVKAWVGSNAAGGGAGREDLVKVLDYEIEPLDVNAPEAVFGFTAATGGATCTMEVDNLVVKKFGVRGPLFVRGDADSNGRIELTDAIRILGFLFLGGANPAPACFDSADSDDNGRLELTDAVRILGFLFLGGTNPPPAPPTPRDASYLASDCGLDPREEMPDLGCVTQAARCRG